MEHPAEDIYRLKQFYQSNFADLFLSKKKPEVFKWKKNPVKYDEGFFKKNISPDFDFKTFKFYAVTIKDVTTINNWRKDFKNNIISPVKPINKINNQNFEKSGDIRYVATISRLHHIPMILAAGLSGNIEDAASIVTKQLHEWKSQNPFLKSINWKNGLEAGVRITNLIYARKIFSLYSIGSAKESFKIIDELAYYHFYFLINHLSLYSSANNHLLFELMGIFIIASNYDFNESEYWKRKSFNWLLKELLKQTHNDGFTKEQSSHYHAEVMNIYALVFAEAQKNGIQIPETATDRFNKMGEALFYLLSNEEELMSIGDSDEGQILFPYFNKNFSLKNSLLKDVYILTNKSFFKNKIAAGYFDLRNYIIWEKEFNNHSEEIYYKPKQQFFKDSGYLFLSFSPVKILFDVGDIGLGKLAAHGHADALQVLLSINNEPFLVDSGTYQYHSKFDKWRFYFRSTLAHNTISVNKASQAKDGGRMIWNTKPEVHVENYENKNGVVTCTAFHDGFIKQGIGVKHTRTITYYKNEQKLIIEDNLSGKKKFTVYFSLHFAPHLHVEYKNDTVILNGRTAGIQLKNPLFNSARLLKGNKENLGGWYSPSFDVLKPTTTLRLQTEVNNEINLITESIITAN